MLWMFGLIALLPLVLLLVDGDWAVEQDEDGEAFDSAAPDLLSAVMRSGTEAEPVWGAWVRVNGFDPDEDLLMVDTDDHENIHVLSSASAEGDTYILLSDGTRIVLDRVPKLPRAPEDILFFVQR